MSGLKVKFQIGTRSFDWEVFVAPIHDPVLLGLDLLRAADVTIQTSGRVFLEDELLPAKIVGGDGSDYSMARVFLEKDVTLPPECECQVYREVDNPKPGVSAVLEPLSISEAVASGSVVTTMERRVPVRLCNLSRIKAALQKGACLGLLIETYPEDLSSPSDSEEPHVDCSPVEHPESTRQPEIRRVTTATDLPKHLQVLFAASSEALRDAQQHQLIDLLLTYKSLFAMTDTDLGYLSAVTYKIDTGTARPARQPVRRTPLGFQGEEEKHLKAMLKAGVVTSSSLEWASPIILVQVASLLPFLTPGHPPKVFASLGVQMHSHLPAAIPEQALHWWCPDPAAESTLGDGPSACWTFLGALKPSSQKLNLSP
ncbi:hypothetical protein SKAU_G00249440 [Synaphobranchus kaupii]|uniref:Uncharacterized protein n=1 Tax=Synaphobranchus kaupii TaxID=118154 RepID=A0A9Q1F2I2_SYNKA|nr:hypothetical protein SKAU_G00249440 [Synaphobranchus kaupii]